MSAGCRGHRASSKWRRARARSAAPMPAVLALVLATLARQDSARAPLVGWYELAPERRALLTFGADGGLRLFDFERPSFDVLDAKDADERRFAWRRQQEKDVAELEIERDARGAVTGFAWSAGGASGHA